MKGVIWTDVFQTFVILVGLIVVIAIGSNEVGGISEVYEISKRGGRLDILEYVLFASNFIFFLFTRNYSFVLLDEGLDLGTQVIMAFIRCELYSFYNVLFSVLTPIHVYDIHSGRWFLAVCLAPCQFIVSDK